MKIEMVYFRIWITNENFWSLFFSHRGEAGSWSERETQFCVSFFSLSQNGNYAKSQQVGLEKGALISQVNMTLIWGCNERWRGGAP